MLLVDHYDLLGSRTFDPTFAGFSIVRGIFRPIEARGNEFHQS
jgi:hypothetical protein